MSITRSSPVQVAGYTTAYSQGPKILSTSWSKVSIGPSHVLAIKSNNTLWSWGDNTYGQLGDGTSISRSSPVQIGTNPTYDWYDVMAGLNYSVALRGDRLLFVWGLNSAGQIGDFTTVNKSSPVQVGTSSWTSVSAGSSHVAAIRSDKKLFVWGNNSYGQLGLSNYFNLSSPVQVGTSSYVSVSAGNTHTTAITTDYQLLTWGDNTTGQLGYTAPLSTYYSWTSIAGNSDYTVAIRNDGLLFAWGTNNFGQLGDGTTVPRSSPTQVGTNSWLVVSAQASTGGGPVLAIRSDNTLWGWGYNVTGVLGVGDTAYRSSPVQVSGGGSWSTVSVSKSHALALKTDYKLYTWGLGTSGQLGDGLTSRSSPVLVGNSSWTVVSSGYLASYAIRSDGILFAWGSNANGALGDSTIATTVLRSSPTQLGSKSWVNVFSYGSNFVHAIDSNNKLYAWGNGSTGQLGYNDIITRSSPVQISSGNWSKIAGYDTTLNVLGIQTDGSLWGWGAKTNFLLSEFSNSSYTYSWSQVSAGPSHTAAIRSDGRLYAWGFNSAGQLGNSTTTNTSSPVLVTASLGDEGEYFNKVSVNGLRTVAITNNGRLFAWGSNAGYLLGDGTSVNRSAPTQITSVAGSWNSVSAGLSHTLAIDSLGRLYSWGDNTTQQLGIGSTDTLRSVPVQIGSSSWSQISSYGKHSLAIDVNNKLYSWGDNTLGQVGSTTLTLSQWNTIESYYTTQIIRSDNIAYAMGQNSGGQIGDNSTTPKSNPVQLAGGGSWIQLVSGYDGSNNGYSIGIKSNGTLYTWGYNANGILGDSLSTTVYRSSPVQVGTNSWLSVSTMDNTAIAIRSDYTLWSWGNNTVGQLGLNDTVNRSSPTQISTGSWAQAVIGFSSVIAIRNDGVLFTWGNNASGELATNTTENRSSPVQLGINVNVSNSARLITDTNSWIFVAGKNIGKFAIRSDYTLWAWGGNSLGRLGLVDTANRSSPVQVNSGFLYDTVASGYDHTIAKRKDGSIWAWGGNGSGQLGLGDTTDRNSPVQVGSSSWVSVNAGFKMTFGITKSGVNGLQNIYSWGYNGDGALGDNTIVNKSSPVLVGTTVLSPTLISSPTQIGTSSFTAISAGLSNSFAIRSDYKLFTFGDNASLQSGYITPATALGTASNTNNNATSYIRSTDNALIVWGANDTGQVGDGTVVNRSSPVQLGLGLGNNQFIKIAKAKLASLGYTLGVKTDGTLWAWGYNAWGQLGNSQTTNRSAPVQIGLLSNWSDVAVGQSHALALKTDGSLWGWGLNTSGQAGVLSWSKVSSGSSHTLAIRSDGQMFAWGSNTVGQLGDNTIANRSSPVQIGTGFSWNIISAGTNISAAIRGDNTLWTWGYNANGALGISGDTSNRSSPTQINSFNSLSWSSISAKGDYMAGILSTGKLLLWGNNTNGQLGNGGRGFGTAPLPLASTQSGYRSAAFPGNGYMLIPHNSVLNLSSGSPDFTIELWVYFTSLSVFDPNTDANSIFNKDGASGLGSYGSAYPQYKMGYKPDGSVYFSVGHGDNASTIGGTQQDFQLIPPYQLKLNTWYHFAATQSSTNQIRVFTNGKLISTTTRTQNMVDGGKPLFVGYYDSVTATQSTYFNGYVSNLRIIKNQAIYTADFTPSTSPLTTTTVGSTGAGAAASLTGTVVLLTCQDPPFVDNSSNNFSITVGGGAGYSGQTPWAVSTIEQTSFTQVATGSATAYITTTGMLYATGLNTSGQLGQNDIVSRSFPVQIGSSSWSIVSSGNDGHMLGLTIDSKLYAWGINNYSQLGLSDTVYRSSPVQVGTSSWTNVQAGTNYSLATRTDNTVWVWGDGSKGNLGIANNLSWVVIGNGIGIHNDYTLWSWGDNSLGQLGVGLTQNRSSPVQIGTVSWTNVYSTTSNSYAIKSDGTLWSWGNNISGQLGLGDTLYRSSPVQVGVDTNWSSIVANATGHVLGLKTTGALFAWGNNTYNELGLYDYPTPSNRSTPVQVGNSSWSKVSAGGNFTLAVTSSGALWAWGKNDYGQTGLNNNTPLSWTTVSNGDSYTVAIRNDGKLFAWGLNSKGQLGDSTTVNRSSPVQISTGTFSYTQVSAILSHTVAIRNDGGLFIWGANDSGQLGQGDTTNRSSPTQVGTSSWTSVFAGLNATYAIRTDGGLFVVGDNTYGQLGQNDVTARSSLVQLGTSSWTTLSASRTGHTLGILSTGALFAWGYNQYNELGLNSLVPTSRSSPVQIGSSSWTKVSAGNNFTLATINTGVLYAWGRNDIGQIGNNALTPLSWTTIANGDSFTMAIRTDGRLYAWGLNSKGQLGDNTTVNRSSPVQVGGNTYPTSYSWTQIAATLSHVLAVRTDGALFAWGANNGGQLGLGDTSNRSAPTQIGSSSWTKVSAGTDASVAIRTDSGLFTWGLNTNGILGQNDTVSRSSPVQVGTSSWTNISTRQHVLATLTTGAMYTWGLNNNGQLGSNTTVDRSSPVQVGTSSWNLVSAGNSFSMATLSTGVLFTWGLGTTGQLGGTGGGATTAAATSRSSPSQIGTSSWSAIASGTSWAAGISAVRLFMWGGSANYELGVGTTASRSSPVQLGLLSWTAIGGTTNPIGIQITTGALFGWGTQAAGQLGQNDVALRSSPVQIASLTGVLIDNVSSPTQIGTSSWSAINAGTSWSGGISAVRLFMWGGSANYELGVGTTAPRSSPVQLGALSWTAIGGTVNPVGIQSVTGALFGWGTQAAGQLGQSDVALRSSPVQIASLSVLTPNVIDSVPSPTQVGTSSWSQISAGDVHVYAIRTDSGLFAWGKNDQGQLGANVATTIHRSSPVQIGTTSWSIISAGNSFGAAVTTLGALYTTGLNTSGQLGAASVTGRSSFTAVGTSSWSQISSGKDFMQGVIINTTNGVVDGYRLFAWGNNNLGQLGLNDTQLRSSPVQVGTNYQTLYSNPTQITSLPSTAIANNFSVFFDNSSNFVIADSTGLNLSGGSWTVEMWLNHNGDYTNYMTMFSKRSIGTVSYEGSLNINNGNILFYNGTIYNSGITPSPNTWHHVAYVYNGTNIIIYLDGVNIYSAAVSVTNQAVPLTIGAYQNAATPTYFQFFNGYISNFRLVKGVAVYTGNFTVPASILATTQSSDTNISAISAGSTQLLTLQNGYIFDNSTNQYAITINGNPRIIPNSNLSNAPIVSAGESHTSIVVGGYQLFETGNNATGQIGDSTTVNKSGMVMVGFPTLYDNRSSPAQIGTGSWSQIAAGLNYSVAINNDGTLWTWGDNTNGVLGYGTTIGPNRFLTQLGTNSYVSISSGGSHTVALRNDLTLYAWGLNNAGQLGDNTTVNRSSPVQVNTSLITNWNAISAGGSYTMGIDATNNIPYGWGYNINGQLGDGTTINKSAPTQINTNVASNYSISFTASSNVYLQNNGLQGLGFKFGTGDFTIEFYFNGPSQTNTYFYDNRLSAGVVVSTMPYLTTGASTSVLYWGSTNTSGTKIIADNTWHHIAVVRISGVVYLYVDGVLDTSVADTNDYSTATQLIIGTYSGGTSPINYSGSLNGYISNLRIIKGTGLYTGGFYPSTGALTTTSQGATASQVSLLTAQSSTVIDNSTYAITVNNFRGTVSSTNPFGPYYSAGFNGTTQYLLTSAQTSSTYFGTGSFTIECFVYLTSTPVLNAAIVSNSGWQWSWNTAAGVGFNYMTTLSKTTDVNTGVLNLNTWYHLALVRDASTTTTKVYVNGVNTGTNYTTDTTNYTQLTGIKIGANRGTNAFFPGYISNLRIVKGVAVYTGNFTAPTNILRTTQSAMTNTVALTGTETILLTLQNSTIVDNSNTGFTFTNTGAVTPSNAYAPFIASSTGGSVIWDSIQAGVNSTMGTTNNSLYTWGSSAGGQLADNGGTSKSTPGLVGPIWSVNEKILSSPVQVGTAKSWSLIATGGAHTIAVATDNSVWSWGQNTIGQLGDATTVGKSSPTQIASNTSSYTFITAGVSNTFAIRATTALLYAWGQNNAGQIGDASTVAGRSSPVQVFTGTMTSPLIPLRLNTVYGSSYTQVQAGSAATVIDSSGRLFTWGTNTNGQVGDNTVVSRSSPVQLGGLQQTFINSPIQVGSSSWATVSAGGSHTLALNTNNLLYAWGKTPANGQSVSSSSPIQIGSSSWLFVSAGNDISQGIDTTRTLYAWGLNTNYQLGSPSFYLNQSVTSPVVIGTMAITNYDNTTGSGAGNGAFIKNI